MEAFSYEFVSSMELKSLLLGVNCQTIKRDEAKLNAVQYIRVQYRVNAIGMQLSKAPHNLNLLTNTYCVHCVQ